MSVFEISLILSALLCSLVAGFLFSYAIVIMPGIKNLNDRQFILTFQVTDRIIQNNNPLFLLVWLGSAIALLVCAVFGFVKLHGFDLYLLTIATVVYLVGVQVSTIAIHLPLNNKLQNLDVNAINDAELHSERVMFESRWNRSNNVRTFMAFLVTVILIILLLRL